MIEVPGDNGGSIFINPQHVTTVTVERSGLIKYFLSSGTCIKDSRFVDIRSPSNSYLNALEAVKELVDNAY